jgi:hypothetical protein
MHRLLCMVFVIDRRTRTGGVVWLLGGGAVVDGNLVNVMLLQQGSAPSHRPVETTAKVPVPGAEGRRCVRTSVVTTLMGQGRSGHDHPRLASAA